MFSLARSNDALYTDLFEFMPSILEKVTEERCDFHEFQNFPSFKFYNTNIFERSIDRNEFEWMEGSEEETIGELSLSENRSIISINQISWMHVAIVDKTACHKPLRYD